MNKELTYRKLATVSFTDFGESRPDGGIERVNGGRLYAAIHRGSPLMPPSLKVDEVYRGFGGVSAPIDTFVIPKMI